VKQISSISVLFFLLIISFNSCNKDKTSPESFRLSSSTYTNFDISDQSYVSNLAYEGNHIVSTSFDNIFKIECAYSGDSIIENDYRFENNIWKHSLTQVLKYGGGLISTRYYYILPDSTKLRRYIYKYEGDNIVEINGYDIVGDSSELYESNKYYYESGKLIKVSFSYKAFPDQDIVENIKREFTYKNGNLYEELIYRDYYGYPIQLNNKKVYLYENERITKVENYNYINNEYVLNIIESREYDNQGNLVKTIETNINGDLVSEQINNYEPGIFSYQPYYNIPTGTESIIPLP